MKRQNQSMLEGPLFVNIILYTIPIILTSLLQLSAVSYAPAMNPVPPRYRKSTSRISATVC